MFMPRCQYSLAAQNDTQGGRFAGKPPNLQSKFVNRPYRTTLNFVGVDALGDPFYRTSFVILSVSILGGR